VSWRCRDPAKRSAESPSQCAAIHCRWRNEVLACFNPQWPNLNPAVACFQIPAAIWALREFEVPVQRGRETAIAPLRLCSAARLPSGLAYMIARLAGIALVKRAVAWFRSG
jgi:hypothetical protein